MDPKASITSLTEVKFRAEGPSAHSPVFTEESRRRLWDASVAAALAALTVATFWPANRCLFAFDDTTYVTDNPWVQQGLTARGIAWAFLTTTGSNWHPLTWLSLMLDRTMWGASPRGFHATNIALHAANASLLFVFLCRATGSRWRSAMVAACFAVHPLRVESVAWIAERKDVLSMFFGLISLISYILYCRRRCWARYLLVASLCGLSMMAKPMLVTFPFLLLLLDFWPFQRWSAGRRHGTGLQREPAFGAAARTADAPPVWADFQPVRPLQLVLEKVPLLVMSGLICIVTSIAFRDIMTPVTQLSLGRRLANATVAWVAYLDKVVRFKDLAAYYPMPDYWPAWQVIESASLLVALTGAAIYFARSARWLAVGWFWFLGTSIPIIGLLQVGQQSMADRYTYFPAIGLIIAVAWSIPNRLADSAAGRCAIGAVTAFILFVLCWATREQIAYWHDDVALFSHAASVTRDNYVAHINVGVGLAGRGETLSAIHEYEAALKIKPDQIQALANIAMACNKVGQFDEARRYAERAIGLAPNSIKAHYGLGIAKLRMGDEVGARAELQRVTQLDPDFDPRDSELSRQLTGPPASAAGPE